MPDMGTWEVYKDGLRLPKFVDVAVTIKLLETPGAELQLYDYNGEIAGSAVKDLTRPVNESPITGL